MKSSTKRWIGFLAALAGFLAVLVLRGPVEVPAYPKARVLRETNLDGVPHVLTDDGNVFRVISERGTWTWVDRVFDPEEIARHLVREGKAAFRVDPDSGRRYELQKEFAEGFEEVPEGVDGLRSLIGEDRKWTEFTLQTPRTPTVSDYVALRQEILNARAGFLDASVAPSMLHAHSGRQSLRCLCPAKSPGMICAKASLGTGFLFFEQGEHFWFQAWFRIAGSTRPFTLADLEGREVKNSPGIRLMLFDGRELGVELKALEKPKYRQAPEAKVLFPTDQWVRVTWHVLLHPDQGQVQVWQDDRLVIDRHGPTLPFRGMMYDSLEVGISAHSFGDQPATLFVDDLRITTEPLIR